jgi:hypothetical protein
MCRLESETQDFHFHALPSITEDSNLWQKNPPRVGKLSGSLQWWLALRNKLTNTEDEQEAQESIGPFRLVHSPFEGYCCLRSGIALSAYFAQTEAEPPALGVYPDDT